MLAKKRCETYFAGTGIAISNSAVRATGPQEQAQRITPSMKLSRVARLKRRHHTDFGTPGWRVAAAAPIKEKPA